MTGFRRWVLSCRSMVRASTWRTTWGESGASGGSDPRLAEEESHQILQQFNYPGECLKLSSGFVPEGWRDIEGIAQTVRQVMRMDPSCVIDYAMPHGDANLRHQIQMRLGIVGIEADLSNIIVTSGASQALDLDVRFMLKPGTPCSWKTPGTTTCSACSSCRA